MFKTPRGLEICIEVRYGFALLARLWKHDPATDAFRVLKTAEGLEIIPSIFGVVGAFVGLFMGSLSWAVVAGLVMGNILGKLLTMFGAFIIPGLTTFATLWSWIHGYGLLSIIGISLAWVLRGWEWAAAWILGSIGAFVISKLFIEPMRMKWYMHRIGFPFSESEVNFINAYRLHADRLGLPRSLDVSQDEITSGEWERCLEDYSAKYPQAVARFL